MPLNVAPEAVVETAPVETVDEVTAESIIQDVTDDLKDSDPDYAEAAEPVAEPVAAAAEPAAVEPVVPAVTPVVEPAKHPDPLAEYGYPKKKNNRIPHERVVKITESAEKKGYERALKELGGDQKPKLQEFETKIQQYEEAFQPYLQFEKIMVESPEQHLQMLQKVPAYKPFFDAIGQLMEELNAAKAPAEPKVDPAVADPMPQPLKGADGTFGYDEAGIQALNAWNARQVKRQVDEEYAKRLAPMEQDLEVRRKFQAQHEAQERFIAEQAPKIQRQIAEARTWEGFNEHEKEITAAIKAQPQLSLEGAYRQVVMPKLRVDPDAIRKQILEEMAQKPTAPTAVAGGQAKPRVTAEPTGSENIIWDVVNKLNSAQQ